MVYEFGPYELSLLCLLSTHRVLNQKYVHTAEDELCFSCNSQVNRTSLELLYTKVAAACALSEVLPSLLLF